MNHRVIFPDPDIWTQPKEHHMTYADQPNAADARRAAALTIHHRRGNNAGVLALLAETGETTRAAELVLAILDLHRSAIMELKTEAGIELMAQYVQALATLPIPVNPDTEGADVSRAAQLLDAHGRGDTDAINHALQSAATAGRPAELVLALLDLFDHLIAELSCEAGIDWLQRCITSFATEENQR
ncbi:hypothetical protein A5761_08690 [Mycolicibacterium setense]|uniref:hypothetical protein n=1 Tax=Mycolicibacterium setense TaxID=431269 RepID=UPI0007E9D553|nr:hypothetical protein [Mycolicibacterium setense]OBB18550.1 hypothetical protein A5761_08690 [Mycolicibacterium setense]